MNNMHGMMPVNQGMHPVGMIQQNSPQQLPMQNIPGWYFCFYVLDDLVLRQTAFQRINVRVGSNVIHLIVV